MNINAKYYLSLCENELIPLIREIANECVSTAYQVEKKGQGNFVTTVDKKIEQRLKSELHQLLPNAGFIAEESGEVMGRDLFWVIDPIDGTTNFIYGLPYAISVALIDESIDHVIIGVVYNPRDNIFYYACQGEGSYALKNNIKKRLRVGTFSGSEGIALFGMPYNRMKTDKIFNVAKRVYEITYDLKRIGPAALDICMVAEGTAKLYFELDLQVWDICAGKLILTEAGGSCRQEGDLYLFGSDEVWNSYGWCKSDKN